MAEFPPLPQALIDGTNQALQTLQSHPKAYVEWRVRQHIYRAFGSYTERPIHIERGWLAILAAQKVLPIFVAAHPYYSLPIHLIAAAIDELGYDRTDATLFAYDHAQHVERLLELAYQVLGNPWLDDYNGHVDYAADMAATAANKALQEAHGWEDPFAHIHSFYIGTGEKKGFMSLRKEAQPQWWEPATNYSEEQWIYLAAVGDTAGAAAIAYAGQSDRTCDRAKLEEFWTWWLQDAIPEAWRLAHWEKVSY